MARAQAVRKVIDADFMSRKQTCWTETLSNLTEILVAGTSSRQLGGDFKSCVVLVEFSNTYVMLAPSSATARVSFDTAKLPSPTPSKLQSVSLIT